MTKKSTEMSEQWQEEDIQNILTNPVYVIGGIISEDDYILAAKEFIKQEGIDLYLKRLVGNLRSNFTIR